MNKLSLWTLSFLFPFLLSAQIQISDIQYHLPVDEHPRKGFLMLNEVEYFIEQGLLETKISRIQNGDLEFMHAISDRPPGTGFTPFITDLQFSNSGLIFDKNYLYEIYHSHIFTIDILTGEVEHVLDLSATGIEIEDDFSITEDRYFFQGKENGVKAYFSYDRQLNQLQTIAFSLDKTVYRIAQKLYHFDELTKQLQEYDLLTEETTIIATANSEAFSIKLTTFNFARHLIIREIDNSASFHIDDQNNFEHLSCLDNISTDQIYLLPELLVYSQRIDQIQTVHILNRETCAEITDSEVTLYSKIIDSQELWGDYIWISRNGDYTGSASIMLYDIADQSFDEVSVIGDSPFMEQSVRYDNMLYTKFYDDRHHSGVIVAMFQINLDTKTSQLVTDYDEYDIHKIIVGESQSDKKLHLYFDTKNESTIQDFDHLQQSAQQVHQFDYLKNVGIDYSTYEKVWYGDKLFFHCLYGIYVLENEEVKLLIETQPPPSIGSTSGFVIQENLLHAMIYLDDVVQHIAIDVNDYSYETQPIENVDFLDYRRVSTDHALVNIPNFYEEKNTGYFSLNDFQFKPFTHNGSVFKTSRYTISGNNILLRGYAETQGHWLMFNTQSETSSSTIIPDGEHPTVFGDGEGGFVISPWHLTGGVFPDLIYLNAQGQSTTIAENFDYSEFNYGTRLDGHVKSIAFDAPDEMVILSMKDDEFHWTNIPDNGLQYYQRFFWKETDEYSVIEVSNGAGYDTYIFSFGTEPIKITPDGRSDRLQEAFIEDGKIVLLYYFRSTETLSFEEYDFASGEITQRNSAEVAGQFSNYNIEYEDGKYIMSLAINNQGYEPWIYNSTSGILTLAKDIKSGFQSSSPKEFMKTPSGDQAYFTAITANGIDRQFFKVDQTVPVKDIEIEQIGLSIIPNPSTNFISITQNLTELRIFDSAGNLILLAPKYTSQQQLDINRFISGTYYINALNKNGELVSGEFVIMK